MARAACQYTLHSQKSTSIAMGLLYKAEHSPIRTQMFWLEMQGIPSFVSTHLVRHHVGVEPFVQTNRDDRGADEVADRNTKVNHAMFINAASLINMARKRLCTGAHEETRKVMKEIKNAIKEVDPVLAKYMVVDCMYRGGCFEIQTCGLMGRREYYDVDI